MSSILLLKSCHEIAAGRARRYDTTSAMSCFRVVRAAVLHKIKNLLMLRKSGWTAIILLVVTNSFSQAPTPAAAREQLRQQLEANRFADAIRSGNAAIALWPGDPGIRHWLGLAYFKSGQLPPAREQLERARDLNKQDESVRFDLALVMLSQTD